MRYYNYLNENSYEDKMKLKDSIKNNAIVKYYLQSNNYYLYRGIKKKIDTYEYFNRKTNRKPVDMPLHLHKLYDEAFQKKFGWKARSNGVFVATIYSSAKYYGTPYLFIPLEPFEYIYSPDIKDLYIDSVEEGLTTNDNPSRDKIKEIVDTYVKNADLYNIIVNHCEIMFNCDKYILMDMYYFKSLWIK